MCKNGTDDWILRNLVMHDSMVNEQLRSITIIGMKYERKIVLRNCIIVLTLTWKCEQAEQSKVPDDGDELRNSCIRKNTI